MRQRVSQGSKLHSKTPSATYGFSSRSVRVHWVAVLLAIVAVLSTLVYAIVASKGYASELAVSGFMGGSQVGLQKFEDEYLAELSRYLGDQVNREMRDIKEEMKKEVLEDLEKNRQLYSEENIRKVAKEELERREVKVKRVGKDYASRYAGCKIYDHSNTHAFGDEAFTVFYVPLYGGKRDPELVIDSAGELTPGRCWPFKDKTGFITLELPKAIKVHEIVYEHVERESEPETLAGSAPRSIEFWGGFKAGEWKLLGETELARDDLSAHILVKEPRVAKYIDFRVLDNYGADFTCLYRISVYANSTSSN